MARHKNEPLGAWKTALIALLLMLAILLFVLFLVREGDRSASRIRENGYDRADFYSDGTFLRYDGAKCLVGIDVSVYQGEVDWQKVRAAGAEFAILRIGFRGASAGQLYEDSRFREYYDGAKAAGLRIGVYFFSQAQTEADARQEAEFVSQLLSGRALELPVFFDWEPVEGGALSQNPATLPLTQCAVAFCRAIEQRGYRAGVYFNQTYGYQYYDLGYLQDFALWLAEYSDAPSFRHHFDFLQYTDEGRLDGIDVVVDLDLWILPEEETK